MLSFKPSQSIVWPRLAWICAGLLGLFLPALALLFAASALDQSVSQQASSPLMAIGLMGMGMIASAITGRFSTGFALAIGAGAVLSVFVAVLGALPSQNNLALGIAFIIASISFAARGALFAKSGGARGWWIALAVVAGEAAIIATAWAEPGAIPQWLLVLLPAQWASIAIEASITGAGWQVAGAALIALGGTAAATMLVAKLWPARWTYSVIFTTWLALSALVWWSGFGG